MSQNLRSEIEELVIALHAALSVRVPMRQAAYSKKWDRVRGIWAKIYKSANLSNLEEMLTILEAVGVRGEHWHRDLVKAALPYCTSVPDIRRLGVYIPATWTTERRVLLRKAVELSADPTNEERLDLLRAMHYF